MELLFLALEVAMRASPVSAAEVRGEGILVTLPEAGIPLWGMTRQPSLGLGA